MTVQTLRLEHVPHPHEVHVVAFKDVANGAFLRDQLLSGNPEFEYAFVDSSVIVSRVHVLAAVHQAVHNFLITKKLRTRNVHSEVVFCLSPNNNITESFRRFGISDTTTSLLCFKISSSQEPVSAAEVQSHLAQVVQGAPVDFTDAAIAQQTDWAKVKSCYKLKHLVTEDDVAVEILGKLVMRTVG